MLEAKNSYIEQYDSLEDAVDRLQRLENKEDLTTSEKGEYHILYGELGDALLDIAETDLGTTMKISEYHAEKDYEGIKELLNP